MPHVIYVDAFLEGAHAVKPGEGGRFGVTIPAAVGFQVMCWGVALASEPVVLRLPLRLTGEPRYSEPLPRWYSRVGAVAVARGGSRHIAPTFLQL